MNSNRINRRKFLKASVLSAASASLLPGVKGFAQSAPASVHSRVIGANDDIRLAVIGFNGRGREHIAGYKQIKGVRIVALCDVDKAVLDKGVKSLSEYNPNLTTYQDLRRVFDDKNIDAVSIATPNHWHSLASIWAIQAGKDVYVEKPISHCMWEGKQLVKFSRKYGQIVAAGTQSRSSGNIREAVEWVQAGNLGKIKFVHGLCYKRRKSIGKTEGPQAVPGTVDYDLWCGPAPKEPPRRKKFHYDWHWFWNTGNGDIGNQGIHQMDVARWFLGEKELAPRVVSIGGRLGYEDDGQTPNTQIAFFDYSAAPLIFEVRGLPARSGDETMDKFNGTSVGVVVLCEHGYVTISADAEVEVFDNDRKSIKQFTGSLAGNVAHFTNFTDTVRSRNPANLHANIVEGHISSSLCHMANISYRLGKIGSPDELREATRNNQEFADTLGRMQEHLGANGVNLKQTPLTVGEYLTLVPDIEKFEDNDQANDLRKTTYRAPFIVPQNV